VQDLTGPVIKAALAEMNNAGLAPASRRRLLTTLRGLCRYLVLESCLPADPTAAIQAPRAPARLPVAFTDGQISALLATAQTEDSRARPAAPLLDVVIVLILAAGGLRASEAAGLRLLDYRSGEEPSLRVVGKGRKARTVPLDTGVAAQIGLYLAWRAEHTVDDGDSAPLLVRPDGRALTRDTISYRVNRLYARAGIVKPDGEAAHALRHTYALSMVDVGVPVSEVQQLLGHESIATTGIYLKASATHLRAASAAPSAARLLTGQRP
ncbi:MAG: tyrosine-type recombinase/integrase, partial [Micrococcaceae bacterium]